MKKKPFISLTLALAFVILALSGLLLYIKQKAEFIELSHTVFGLLFIGIAFFHIRNNWGSIKNYSKDKTTRSFKKELAAASLVTAAILVLSVTEVLEPVGELGKIFAQPKPRPKGISFEEQLTRQETSGIPVTLLLQKKERLQGAALTVEVTDTLGKLTETLYKPAPDKKGPSPNLILQTRISTTPPFRLVITAKDREQQQQQTINIAALGNAMQPLPLDKTAVLQRGYLQVTNVVGVGKE